MKKLIIAVFIVFPLNAFSQDMMDILIRTYFNFSPVCFADTISYPVNHGKLDGYYDAQPFGGKSNHLGADINGNVYGNSDLGDTIYSIGNGKVITVLSTDRYDTCTSYILQILHKTKKGYIVSQYRHCKEIFVQPDQYVNYLQPIATIGTECGIFLAHLQFEIRTDISLPTENGYGDLKGFVDPMKFIKDFNEKN
jgi:murein DD-endopeptidase MepM/ murein hydrolase activator NlpD